MGTGWHCPASDRSLFGPAHWAWKDFCFYRICSPFNSKKEKYLHCIASLINVDSFLQMTFWNVKRKNINKSKKKQETTIRLIQTIRTNDFVHVLAPVSSYSAPSRWRAANLFSIAAGKRANWPVPLVVQNTMFWPNTHIIHRRKFLARNPFKGGGEITKLARNERAHGGAKPPPKGLIKAW